MRSLDTRPLINRLPFALKSPLFKLGLLLAVVGAVLAAVYVTGETAERTVRRAGTQLKLTPQGKQLLNLQQPSRLNTDYRGNGSLIEALRSGNAHPLGLAIGDLNRDGAPDLVVGYAFGQRGFISVQRGNPDAFVPTKQEIFNNAAKGILPPTFQTGADVLDLPEAPNFIFVQDLNGDGYADILTAARGGAALQLFDGNGDGGFAELRAVPVEGSISALTAGSFSQPFGTTMCAIAAVNSDSGHAAKVYTANTEKVFGDVASYALPAAADAIQIGALDDDPYFDFAAAAGSELVIVHGHEIPKPGRDISTDTASRLERVTLDAPATDLALGNFIADGERRSEVAVLSTEGTVELLKRGQLSPVAAMAPTQRSVAQIRSQYFAYLKAKGRVPVWQGAGNQEWTKADGSAIQLGSGGSVTGLKTFAGSATDQLMFMDQASRQMKVVGSDTGLQGATSLSALSADGTLVASLTTPQKVNGDRDLIVLSAEDSAPGIIPAAATVFNVNTTTDLLRSPIASQCNNVAGDCSLREAVIKANTIASGTGHTINVPSGTYNLSLTNPNTPGTTGTGGLQDLQIGSASNAITTVMGTGGTKPNIVQTVNTGGNFNDVITTGFTAVGSGLAVVNLTLQNLDVSGGNYTGIFVGVDNGPGQVSTTLINNCNIHNNSAHPTNAFGQGGGIQSATGHLTLTNTTLINNTAPGTTSGQGGGLAFIVLNASGTGGIGNLSIDKSFFTTNSASVGSGFACGGGAFVTIANASATASITDTTFKGNSCTQAGAFGGGLAVASNDVMALNRNRFRSNVVSGAGTGSGLRNSGSGAINAENNWWGCDDFPTAAPCDTATANGGSGAIDSNPRIDLQLTASPSTICRGTTSTITAAVNKNTDNANVNGGNAPFIFTTTPFNFVFSVAGPETITPAPLTVLIPAGGTVAKTFTAGPNHGTKVPTVKIQDNITDEAGSPQGVNIIVPDSFTSAATGNFNVATTWTPQCVPQSDDSVTIIGPHTVTLPGASDIADVTLNAGGVLALSTFNLNVNSTNNQKAANYIGVNTWTGGGGTITGTGGITLNGTGASLVQTVSGTTTFPNLTTSGTGTKGFSSSSNTISNAFNHGGGTMDGGTSTFTFTGNPGSIGGANAKSFFNLVVNAGAVITNSTGGNTTINNNFTNDGTYTQDATLTTTFAGTTHALAGGGATTFGIITIQGSNTVNAGSHNFTFVGTPFTITGTFNGQTGTVTAGGSAAQTIAGAGTKNFNNLVINNAAGVTLSTAASVAGTGTLTLTNGAFANGANLTLGNGATISRSGGTLGAAPTFTTSANVIYTAPTPPAAITTGPELPTSASVLNNLTINNASGVNLNANATVNGTLALTAGVFAVGANTLTLNNGSSVGTGSLSSATTGTVNYNQGSAGQVVLAANYGNLTFSNQNKTLPNGSTIGVANVFTPGTAVGHTITGNTFDFNGTGAQTVPAFNYNNLTISGARGANNVTLINGGTIGVAGTFNPTATFAGGAYVITGNTINYNSTGAQTITPFNYFNLTFSGARTVNNVTLPNAGTIGVAGTLSSTATFTSGAFVLTGSTVEYNGSSVQALSSTFPTYFNLTLNNTAGTTGFAGLTVQNLIEVKAGTFTSSSTYKDVQIDAGATLAASGGSTINVSGSWTNNGSFTGGTGTVNFNGAATQTLGGSSATTFNNLTNSNAAGLTFGQNQTVGGVLALTSGDINTSTFTLNMPGTGTSSGNFDVVGNVKRTGFVIGTPLSFGNPFNTITIEAGGTIPTDINVKLEKAAPTNFSTAVQRNYDITPNGPYGPLTLRLHYLDSELNTNNEATMNFRRFDGVSAYQPVVATSRDTTNNWLQKTGQTALSIWTFSSNAPTAASAVITGHIADQNGNAVEGAVINLSGTQNRKTITDSKGNYRFENVETTGFYTVRASRANYTFSPQERSFAQIGNQTEAGFTAELTSATKVNPVDTAEYFVRQHYIDFLGREPDEAGFNFWSDQILGCGADAGCVETKRINVSAAYFLSIEFQTTGGLVDGVYRASFDRAPQYGEFTPDRLAMAKDVVVGKSGWEQQLAANRQAYLDAFVQRPAFQSAYGNLSNTEFVDALVGHTRISYTQSERDALVNGLTNGSLSRAAVLGQIAGDQRFVDAKFNQAFVMMEYFGYLRRDADADGYQFWLTKLNQFNGNYEQADMVKAFIVSGEYRDRFPR